MKSKILSLMLVLAFVVFGISNLPTRMPEAADYTNGIGTIKYYEEREIANGLTYSNMVSQSWGWQRGHQLVFNPQTADIEVRATYGASIYGGDTMSTIVNNVESNGEIVFAAFNGDFYEVATGIPNGIIINDGRILTAVNGNNAVSIGFKASGEVVIAAPRITMNYSVNGGSTSTINRLNKSHLSSTSNVFLHTPEFGASTRSLVNSTEVVLQVNSGDLVFGGVIKANVVAVNENATNTSIGNNQMVLSSESFSNSFVVGDEVTINVNETTGQFTEVVEAISGNSTLLVTEGVRNPALDDLSDRTAYHPRTTIGVRADGTVVVHLNDGRQPGFSEGITDRETADYMVEQGCVTAVRIDGGGSATMAIRFPGETQTKVVNSPSDGRERSNANAMVLVAKIKTVDEFAKLHAYPGKIVALENTVIDLKVLATDKNFLRVATPTLEYEVIGDVGTIDSTGHFIAKSGTGAGKIVVKSGEIYTEIEVEIIASVDEIYLDQNNLPLGLGETVKINASAYAQGMLLMCSNEAFNWRLDPETLGTISDNGTFVSGQTAGVKGKIIVSYGEVSAEVQVTVGELPILIEDFETAAVGNAKGLYGVRSANGATGTIEMNNDERYVKFGYSSLKIDFDHTKATGTGTTEIYKANAAGTYPSTASDYIQIEGRPSHIGMWVYATPSAQTAWLRLQCRVGAGSGDVKYIDIASSVNWTGWKYVEASIAEGESTPIGIQYVVRVLSTANNRIKGTIYVDGIRAVYGFRDDDMANPTISNVAPADGEKIISPEPVISADLIDTGTGINRDKTRLWINNVEMEGLTFNNITNGYRVNYVPNVLTRLKPGSHRIKVRTEDFFGNFVTHEWTISVNADTVELNVLKPDGESIYAGQTESYTVQVNKYDDFERYSLLLSYNPKAIDILNIGLPEGVEIITKLVDDVNGKINIVIQGMNYLGKISDDLVKIDFKTKVDFVGDAFFTVEQSDVKDTKIESDVSIYIDNMTLAVFYKYVTQYTGATINRPTTIRVVEGNKAVSGAVIHNNAGLNINGLTNIDGVLVTDLLTQFPIGTKIMLYAEYNGLYAQPIEFVVVDSLGTVVPDFVIIAAGQDPSTSMHFGWMTNLSVDGTFIRYAIKGTGTFTTKSSDDNEAIMIDGREILSHHISLTDLTPGTTYEYQVGDGTNFSQIMEFTTASELGIDISLLYFTDPQASNLAGYDPLVKIYEEAYKINPDIYMAIASGDISDNGNNWQYWNYFYQKMGTYVSNIPTSFGSGNHESSNMPMFGALFNNPGNGVEGLKGSNFYIEMGNIIIAYIDSEAGATKIEEQRLWLIDVMNNSNALFKVVIMHRGPYSIYYSHQAFTTLNTTFESLGIDLVITGHDHIYNRTVANGVTYIVGGSAGTKYYDDTRGADWPEVIYDGNNPVFGIIDVTAKELIFRMYAIEGSSVILIDEVTIASALNSQIEEVIDLIKAIGEVTLDSKELIEAAQAAYELLDEEQQALVSNYQVLVTAWNTYNELYEDYLIILNVIDLITAIGEVTLDSNESIEAARAAYELLTASQQALVTNYQVLSDAEIELVLHHFAVEKAEKIDQLISTIETISIENWDNIYEINDAYEALSDLAKYYVTMYDELAQILDEIDEEIDLVANNVIALIDTIGVVTRESRLKIDIAQTAYDALPEVAKARVTNYMVLLEATVTFNNLGTSSCVISSTVFTGLLLTLALAVMIIKKKEN